MGEPWTIVVTEGDKVLIKTTRDQALMIARGLRHFYGAGEPNRLEADRAMLRQLGDWSKDLETVG